MSKIENTKMLEDFVARKKYGAHPVPLKETSYDIEVSSGLATVRQTRRFRNDEKRPIEAILSFPVAFDAVVTSLECEVAGRRLKGQAQAKQKARQTYETAIDSGKTAVLHEELLRGLHMVSVANVAPDAEIVVTATYVMPLALAEGHADFRVPLTIGQIFGQLPLQDSDQVKLGGDNADVKVSIRSSSGQAYVNGERPKDGVVSVKLNDVINVRVEELVIESLSETAADGRRVRVDFAPDIAGEQALDIDVMIDTSGSMGERPTTRMDGHTTKFQIVEEGLKRAFAKLGKEDTVGIWEFNDYCHCHGRSSGASVVGLLGGIAARNKGTNLAEAVAKTVASRKQPQILLITDGRAGRMIDVQAALAAGARITVVLVGEDSLEVNVGYLASQSGGKMFVVAGTDADKAIEAAIASMRSAASPVEKINGELTQVVRGLSGVTLTATWGAEGGREATGVAALAAHLAMSSLDEERAGALAASEGIVSHLTSIVLVDEEGATLDDLPEQRKVGLPESALGGATRGLSLSASGGAAMMFSASLSAAPSGSKGLSRGAGGQFRSMKSAVTLESFGPMGLDDDAAGGSVLMELEDEAPVSGMPIPPLGGRGSFNLTNKGFLHGVEALFKGMDWNKYLAELTSIPVGILPATVAGAIIRVGALDAFIEASDKTKVPATSLAIAVLALLFAPADRTAQRIARKILSSVDEKVVDGLKSAVEAGL
ncbi:Vault protein inter-alpha-trypsin [compost metagenome]